MSPILLGLAEGLAAGLVVSFALFLLYSRSQRRAGSKTLATARTEAEAMVSAAAAKAGEARNQMVLEGKMEILRLREDLDREAQRRREEWERFERRAEERDRSLEHKLEEVRRQESGFTARERTISDREEGIRKKETDAERLVQDQRQKLERIAGLGAEEARREVLQRAEDETKSQAQALARDIREQAKRSAEKDARKIVAMAV